MPFAVGQHGSPWAHARIARGGRRIHDHERGEPRQRVRDRQDLLQLRRARQHAHARLGVIEDVAHLGCRERGVDRHGDRTLAERGEVRDRPLVAVLRQQRDAVAAPHAQPGQAQRQALNIGQDALRRQRFPAALAGGIRQSPHEVRGLPVAGHRVEEDADQRVRHGPSVRGRSQATWPAAREPQLVAPCCGGAKRATVPKWPRAARRRAGSAGSVLVDKPESPGARCPTRGT